MTSRPIIFSAPLVRALLAGRKTQTRRLVRMPADAGDVVVDPGGTIFGPGPYLKVRDTDPDAVGTMHPRIHCPYGYPGERLWVRETHAQFAVGNRTGVSPQCVAYRATCDEDGGFDYVNNGDEFMRLKVTKWTPAIFMPRWASRITLEVTGIRVERLQDITEDDAKAEGVESHDDDGVTYYGPFGKGHACARVAFERLWDEINGDRAPWSTNPWVWALTFNVITGAGR